MLAIMGTIKRTRGKVKPMANAAYDQNIVIDLEFTPSVPAAVIAHKTRQDAKRGCGRGCSTCKNFAICHGEKQLGWEAK